MRHRITADQEDLAVAHVAQIVEPHDLGRLSIIRKLGARCDQFAERILAVRGEFGELLLDARPDPALAWLYAGAMLSNICGAISGDLKAIDQDLLSDCRLGLRPKRRAPSIEMSFFKFFSPFIR